MGKIAGKLVFALLIVVMISTLVQSVWAAEPTVIISNSADWTDAYSVMLFGSLTGRSSTFLVSDRHATLITPSLSPGSHIWVISSNIVPFSRGFENYLESQGFTTESFEYDNVNLELARQYDADSYVIIDDSYGYNAVSAAPYAVASKSFVLFADERNIDDVDAFLTGRNPSKVLIYGHVDRAVKNALSKYSPEVINNDGDRFSNNIELVKRLRAISGARQVILTNGEFIENEIMSGKEPVIFIGRNNVPDVVREYISQSDIEVGVLIGNELVNTATFVRRQIGISVFVKFARSSRSPGAAITQVEALDMFYLPVYGLNLELDSVSYNRATNQLEAVLHNTRDQAAYFKGTYTITNADGSRQTVGDAEPVFIEPNSYKTVTFLTENLDENSAVDVYIIYGESKNSLEYAIDEQYCISCQKGLSMIDVIDKCEMNITSISYNLPRKLFYVDATNLAETGCFADVELTDVIVAAERVTYHLSDVAFLEAGQSKTLKIKGELEEEDMEDNSHVNAKLFYGQRENSLIKAISGRYPLLISTSAFSMVTFASYAALAAIAAIASMLVWKMHKPKKRKIF